MFSVLSSGYSYTFDTDELFHAHYTYLVLHGYHPFADFYASVYTPLFSWFLAPLFSIQGFILNTLWTARVAMIGLFILRIAVMMALVKQLFGGRTTLIFLPIFLLDPFTVFAAMQIRPDNLMMTVYIVGLWALSQGLSRRSLWQLLWAGVLLGVSTIILAKILPSICVVFLGLLMAAILKRKFYLVAYPAMGFLLSLFVFLFYALVTGIYHPLVMQLIIDAQQSFAAFRFPVQIGNFYLPNNLYIFGVPGKPLNWLYAWLLLFGAWAGAYHLLYKTLTSRQQWMHTTMTLILVSSLVAQQLSLFAIPSVFIQYYLPVSWLYALFTAVALADIIAIADRSHFLRVPVYIFAYILLVVLIHQSTQANFARAVMIGADHMQTIQRRLTRIPNSASVFPNILFRPLSHPHLQAFFMGVADVPETVLARYPRIKDTLERDRVPYIVITSYSLGLLSPEIQQYVKTHYTQDPEDLEFYTRN